jgi:hypothetical protein
MPRSHYRPPVAATQCWPGGTSEAQVLRSRILRPALLDGAHRDRDAPRALLRLRCRTCDHHKKDARAKSSGRSARSCAVLFSRFAALSGMGRVRKTTWLPDMDSNPRSRLGESAGSMFSDIVGYSRLARQSAVSCLTGGAVRECSGWARVSLRSVSIYMDDCSTPRSAAHARQTR